MFFKLSILFVLMGSLTSIGFVYYKNETKHEKVQSVVDQVTLTFESELEKHKMDDLKIALLLAENTALVDALEVDDEDLGYQILLKTTQKISQNTNIRIRSQIITKEHDIFARSWDDMYAGMPLGDYRTDLEYFKTHKTPRVSIEVGRRLGIKATVPIYKDNEFLGFVEVISFFTNITEYLASMGIDLYVLLDLDYTDTAVFMIDNLSVNDYVIANTNYNSNHIATLNSIDFKKLKLNNILFDDKRYIFHKVMYDGDYNIIGSYVFVLPEKYLDYFRNPEDDISFLINVTRSELSNILQEEKSEKSIYDEYSATSMAYLQDAVSKDDREEFLHEAYLKFDKYTKDELIQMMLDRKIIKKIDGTIK